MLTLNRATPPPIHHAIDFSFKLPPINRASVNNNIPFYWLNAGVQDVVEIDWVFSAGLWQEPKPAIAEATASLLKNGTTSLNAHQINESFEFYGASFRVVPSNDFTSVSLFCLTKHLSKLLPVVYDVLLNASFPEEELAIFKQNSIQRLMVNLKQCDFVANQKIDELIFGSHHPYGRFTRKETIEAITREDMITFYKEHYNLNSCKIFMAGKIAEQELNLLQSFAGGGDAKGAINIPGHTTEASAEKRVHFINDPNGVQAAIRIGREFPNRRHPDFAPMVVLNTLFGGYFGSRLMSNIREEKGYTYGIHSSLSPFLQGGALTIHSEVGREVAEASITEVFKEMEILQQSPADDEEILLVKNYLLGSLLGDLDGPFQILQRWKTLILNDMPPETFDRNINIYKTITAAQLQKYAQQYFNKEDYYQVTVI